MNCIEYCMYVTKLQIQYNKISRFCRDVIIKLSKYLDIPKSVMSNVVKHLFNGVSIACVPISNTFVRPIFSEKPLNTWLNILCLDPGIMNKLIKL